MLQRCLVLPWLWCWGFLLLWLCCGVCCCWLLWIGFLGVNCDDVVVVWLVAWLVVWVVVMCG